MLPFFMPGEYPLSCRYSTNLLHWGFPARVCIARPCPIKTVQKVGCINLSVVLKQRGCEPKHISRPFCGVWT